MKYRSVWRGVLPSALALALGLDLALGPGCALADGAAYGSSDSLWIADLEVFEEELPARHKNLFFKMTPEDFAARVRELREQLPGLEPYERVVSLMNIVAAVGDSHTMINADYSGLFRKLPVLTEWFSDGLYVMTTVPEYGDFLGARVVRMGNAGVDELLDALEAVIPHENYPQLMQRVPLYMMIPEVLAALGVADSPDSVEFSFESGASVMFPAMSPLSRFNWTSIQDSLRCEPPLYLQNQDLSYWHTYLEEEGTLYVQYRRCSEMKEHAFSDFTQEVLALIDEKEVAKVIFDMRLNGGGNSAIVAPMIEGIAERESINKRGSLFVVVGRETYSSAILNALEFRSKTNAIFVGRPTGGKPNHYGEVKFFPLPNSRVIVTYSTKYFTHSDEDTQSFMPDIEVENSFDDFRSCRDPVMERISAL